MLGAAGPGVRVVDRTDEPRSSGPLQPEGEKPTPKPGDIYEIDDDTGAIIIAPARRPAPAFEQCGGLVLGLCATPDRAEIEGRANEKNAGGHV